MSEVGRSVNGFEDGGCKLCSDFKLDRGTNLEGGENGSFDVSASGGGLPMEITFATFCCDKSKECNSRLGGATFAEGVGLPVGIIFKDFGCDCEFEDKSEEYFGC